MNGGDIARIREELGMGRVEFARALGFDGPNLSRRMTRLEMGKVPMTDNITRRVQHLRRRAVMGAVRAEIAPRYDFETGQRIDDPECGDE